MRSLNVGKWVRDAASAFAALINLKATHIRLREIAADAAAVWLRVSV